VPSTLPSGIRTISADEVTEMGSQLTRVSVRFDKPGTAEAVADGESVVITLPAPAPVAMKAAADPVPPVAATAATAPSPAPVEKAAAKTPPPAVKAAAVKLPKARVLRKIDTDGSGASITVQIQMDGDASYSAFKLENPSRVVIDLAGIRDAMKKKVVAVNEGPVKQVRAGQFSKDVTRVVVDLNEKTTYNVARNGDRLVVTFGDAAVAADAAAPVSVPTPASAKVANATEPAPPAAKPADLVSQIPAVAENAPSWKMPADASNGAVAVIHSEDQTPPPAPPPASTTVHTQGVPLQPQPGSTTENVFSTPGQPTEPAIGAGLGGTRTLSAGERVYTGEPISLNLKDADLKDVLRTFAELTGLNMAIDPDVAGSVTVDFVDVPWDQALDIILRQNKLSYVLEGNVMRIGRLTTLSEETAANQKLQEQERLNKPLTTVVFHLSYARANDVQTLLRGIASPRAHIIIDQRTNQIIISEIPEYLQTIRNLIDSVDVPNRQVLIEARIVETTQTFLQQYGFNWGFRGTLDPSLGTGTGLVFPSRIDTIGGPFDFGPGNPVLSFSLANVLGTFTLDVALNAAEQESIARVIAAPRVQTQDNVAAQISAGTQIPFQTRINFTTTVQYFDATLSLTVTPQITEAGTVIMDIAVQKNDPGPTAANAPGPTIQTRSAHTRLMVRDGGTAVIAGIYQTNDTDLRNRLPFLHQIPIIGNLFKGHDINSTHQELLIFITPRIVRTT
ncbi:MAG TPA: type IV pilus secretin PilQ, partial [Thermoanaerobaculia bacterium]|nr:type IV pilus secretin PilQ [Thermoanaerobaculia bacterium]